MSAIPDVRVGTCPDPSCNDLLIGTSDDLTSAIDAHMNAQPHADGFKLATWGLRPATGQDLTNWLAWQQIEAQRRAVDVAERLADLSAAESSHEGGQPTAEQ